MRTFYNDFDKPACEWLSELCRRGLIADGVVHHGSIKDIKPEQLAAYRRVHLFAGIGGWELALQLAGFPDDAEVWTGSCPCQPYSSAGKRKGNDDERNLWPEMFRLVDARRPELVFGEQVASAIGHGWLDGVFADLEGIGYTCGAVVLGAHSVGAPHMRQRLWWVADATGGHAIAEWKQRGGQQRLLSKGSGDCRLVNAKPLSARTREQGQQRCSGSGRNRLAVPGEGCGIPNLLRTGLETVVSQQAGYCATGSETHGGVGHAGANGAVESNRAHADAIEGTSAWADAGCIPCGDGKTRRLEPSISPLVDGVPARVVRLRGYGNAIVPQVAASFITAYMDVSHSRSTVMAATKSRHAKKSTDLKSAKPVKAHVLTPAEIERKLPDMPEQIVQQPPADARTINVMINAIDIASGNRDESAFTPEALEGLRLSIARRGLLQPILVRKGSGGQGTRFELIAGERRLTACKQLGWTEIPAYVREATLDDRLAENIHRADLTFAEESDQVYAQYQDELLKDEAFDGIKGKEASNAAIAQLAVRLGKSQYWVRERLMLAGLDQQIKDAVLAGQLSLSVARKLAQIECSEDQKAAAKAIKDRMTQARYRGLPTADELNRIIGEYLYRLQGVKWRLDQPFAGKPACDTCEHNSNNSLWRVEQLTKDGKPIASFRDGASKSDGVAVDAVLPKEGVCSKGDCYRVKAEQAKAAVDRAAGRAVTHLSRQAEASLGAKASPRKVAEQALILAKRSSVTAGLIPEGISGAAVIERVKPKLERMSQATSSSSKKTTGDIEAKKREERDREWNCQRQARDEYNTQAEQKIKQVEAPLLAELAKDTTRALIVEMVAKLPAVKACASFDQRARTAAFKRRELDETLAIVAMEPAKALRAIAAIRFGKTGLGKHNPLAFEDRDNDLSYYPTAFIAIMQRVSKLLGVALPDVTLEDEDAFVTRRMQELLNPQPEKTKAEAPQATAVKRVPKVAPARKSSSNKARVPDVEAEEDPPRGQGDVDRDEAEGSEDE